MACRSNRFNSHIFSSFLNTSNIWYNPTWYRPWELPHHNCRSAAGQRLLLGMMAAEKRMIKRFFLFCCLDCLIYLIPLKSLTMLCHSSTLLIKVSLIVYFSLIVCDTDITENWCCLYLCHWNKVSFSKFHRFQATLTKDRAIWASQC